MPTDQSQPPSGEMPKVGASQTIPSVVPPRKGSGFERDERNQLEKDGVQSYNVRRAAAYGGLAVAAVLYLAGLYAVWVFLEIVESGRVLSGTWHIVVATLLSLFTIPTVLVIVILRAISPNQGAKFPITAHEAIGQGLVQLLDKIFSK